MLSLTIHRAKLAAPVDCQVKVKFGDFSEETVVEKKADNPMWNKNIVLCRLSLDPYLPIGSALS